MRTIKYRGKTKNGEWLYGDHLQVANEVFIAPSDGDWFDFIPWSRNNVFHLPAAKYAVIPETVGQFTGLLDKNGKDIYEGDIMRIPETEFNIEIIGVVEFDRGSYVVRSFFSGTNSSLAWAVRERQLGERRSVVIGNIYDNPELLNK